MTFIREALGKAPPTAREIAGGAARIYPQSLRDFADENVSTGKLGAATGVA